MSSYDMRTKPLAEKYDSYTYKATPTTQAEYPLESITVKEKSALQPSIYYQEYIKPITLCELLKQLKP